MYYPKTVIDNAKRLRRNGYSLGQIAFELKISKSTASLWTSKVEILDSGKIKICERQDKARQKAFKTISDRRKIILENISNKATVSFNTIKMFPAVLKLITAIFIWTEGEKGNFSRVGFTNSDPVMIKTFLYTLRKSFKLDETKFRALVHIHEYHNEKEILKFWSENTNIPINKFTKSYLKPHTAKRKRENYMGSIHISYYDYTVARELASLYNTFARSIRL